MQNVNEPQQDDSGEQIDTPPPEEANDRGGLWAALGILAVLLAWRWRHGRSRA
jgi:hypothetical protein